MPKTHVNMINRVGIDAPERQGCQSGLSSANRPDPTKNDGKWHGIYSAGDEDFDNPLNFALFGLARQESKHFPNWTCADFTMPVLDLGPGKKVIPGATRLDFPEYDFDDPNTAYSTNLNSTGLKGNSGSVRSKTGLKEFEDDSVGGIFAVNILEHLWDPRYIMTECARVLAPGCPMNIVVPDGGSPIYYQDLDHKKPFNLDSFRNWLFNPFYGNRKVPLRIAVGFKFSIKEGNENLQFQLIKEG